jgi:hypothetical protein
MRDDWISPFWHALLLPETTTIARVKLRPLTVWHTLALEQVNNAYMYQSPEAPTSMDDIASLLLIARGDMRLGRRLFSDYQYRLRAFRWVYKRLVKRDFDDLDLEVSEYMATSLRHASRWQGETGKAAFIPYQYHLAHRLTRDWGASEAEAWNAPFVLARCKYDTCAEAAGDDSLMSPQAQEMEDNWQEVEPAMKGDMKIHLTNVDS